MFDSNMRDFEKMYEAMHRSIDDPNWVNEEYTSILELDKKLTKAKIPHERIRAFDGWKISYPSERKCVFDVIQHWGSYGSQRNLMEAMGIGIEDVEGYLDTDTAFVHFKRAKCLWDLHNTSLFLVFVVGVALLIKAFLGFTKVDVLPFTIFVVLCASLVIAIRIALWKHVPKKGRALLLVWGIVILFLQYIEIVARCITWNT